MIIQQLIHPHGKKHQHFQSRPQIRIVTKPNGQTIIISPEGMPAGSVTIHYIFGTWLAEFLLWQRVQAAEGGESCLGAVGSATS